MKHFNQIFQELYQQQRNLFYEHEAYNVLERLGLEVPTHHFVPLTEPLEKWVPAIMSIPSDKVVLKIVSPDILHKMEAGGVKILNKNQEQILHSYYSMRQNVQHHRPDAEITGFLFTEFLSIKYEILISLISDPEFGLFLSVGFGGIYTEIFRDIKLALTPAPREYLRKILRSMQSYPIFQGYRGLPAVPEEKLLDVLDALNKLGAYFSPHGKGDFIVEEFEINPFAITGDHRIVAIDSILHFSPQSNMAQSLNSPNTTNLDNFFNSTAVTVIGATETPGKVGTAIMQNLLKTPTLSVYPVNPTREAVMGEKCYPTVNDIPASVDLAVVAVPARNCPATIQQCVEKDIKAVVLITGGFKEFGAEGASLQEELAALVSKHGIRIVGPNCIGVFSSTNQINTFFLPEERMRIPDLANNNLVILSQSGGLAINFVNTLENVGVRSIVSYGNMLDADTADFIHYFDQDPGTGVILVYAEGFNNRGRKLFETINNTQTPIVFLKGGKSEIGAQAALSHTGAMAGDYRRAHSALAQAGIMEATSMQEALDYTKIFSLLAGKTVAGPQLAIITNAGGLCILGADVLPRTPLCLASFTPDTLTSLSRLMESYVKPHNPLDLGGGTNDTTFLEAVNLVRKDPQVDCLCLLPTIEPAPINQDTLIEQIAVMAKSSPKPIVTAIAQNQRRDGLINYLESNQVPVYATPEQAVLALGVYVNHFYNK